MQSVAQALSEEMDTGSVYRVQVSQQVEDAEWDHFLSRVPDGHHVQSSLWAKVKAPLGWRTERVIVKDLRNQILAGGQLLIRSMAPLGDIGYVTKGPVSVSSDSLVSDLVISELKRIAKREHLQCLIIQPADDGFALEKELSSFGFKTTSFTVMPITSVVIDLTKDFETIEAEMHKKLRANIRRALRKGIEVREGTREDVKTFHKLLYQTSVRCDFVPYSVDYFLNMWDTLSPNDHIKLFITEVKGEPVSALLTIPFGKKVVAKKAGWSGGHSGFHPNEVMHHAAIKWAKENGYEAYDFDGIEPEAAEIILKGEDLPSEYRNSSTHFKLRFSKSVEKFPEPHDYIRNPFVRLAFTGVVSKIGDLPIMDKVTSFITRRNALEEDGDGDNNGEANKC